MSATQPSSLPPGTQLVINAVRCLLNMAQEELDGGRPMDPLDLALMVDIHEWFYEHTNTPTPARVASEPTGDLRLTSPSGVCAVCLRPVTGSRRLCGACAARRAS